MPQFLYDDVGILRCVIFKHLELRLICSIFGSEALKALKERYFIIGYCGFKDGIPKKIMGLPHGLIFEHGVLEIPNGLSAINSSGNRFPDPIFRDLGQTRKNNYIAFGNLQPRKRIWDALRFIKRNPNVKRSSIIIQDENWIIISFLKIYYNLYLKLKKNIPKVQITFIRGKLRKDELNNFYNTSEYMIFPSIKEGAARVPVEAAKAGCRIILSTNINDGTNKLLDYKNFYTFDPLRNEVNQNKGFLSEAEFHEMYEAKNSSKRLLDGLSEICGMNLHVKDYDHSSGLVNFLPCHTNNLAATITNNTTDESMSLEAIKNLFYFLEVPIVEKNRRKILFSPLAEIIKILRLSIQKIYTTLKIIQNL